MKKAVCPGSFDPITNGHVDIIKRASELFDEVTVLVVTNPDKKCIFSPEERCALIKKATENIPGIKVDCFSGLLADYVRKNEVCAIVKGIRSSSDFEYEFQMALANRSLAPSAETVFITADPQNMYVSSSLIRQIAAFGGDVSDFVPKNIVEEIEKRLK
ncbi:MAG: pantetheine-phosphate adenylyltransferase [Oscillospiraceae bacterium]|nr:pantetheine-phosphate adenylyltransferase [Oscillospiraceae bacterium]